MTNPVVTIAVSVQTAPSPSTLQKTGAFLSQGGTNTSPGTMSLLTQAADLTSILKAEAAITSIAWATGVASVTTTAPHGLPIGDTVPVVIAGAVPSGYNGTFLAPITGASSFTYPLASSPGSETTPGTWSAESGTELQQMTNTFFAQGAQQSVYVLELGPGSAATGVAFLTSWIAANPNTFYSYLVPRYWDADSHYLSFLANFESNSAKTYFFTTTTLSTWQNYTPAMKCVVALIEAPSYSAWSANVLTSLSWAGGQVTATTTTAHGVSAGQYFTLSGSLPAAYNGTFLALPGTTGSTLVYALASNPGAETALGTLVASQYASTGIPSTEFSLAGEFRVTLNYAPSSTNRVTPLNYAYLFGVTTFPTQGNNALITTLLAGNINLVGTGAQGGISNSLVLGGHTMDGNPFKYWYSVDWAQVYLQRNVTAALINGANNPVNPVDYNQPGINTLQQAAVSTMVTGVGNGLVLNAIKATTYSATDLSGAIDAGTLDGYTVVNADPFGSYATENPSDYAAGIYNGLFVDFTPLRGFESVRINLNISSFANG